MTLAEIEANLATMAELARLHRIRVVLSSVLPVNNYTERSKMFFPLRPPAQIVELNQLDQGLLRRRTIASISTTSAPWWMTKAC